MTRVRVHNLAISLDGFGAGEGQSLETPFGHAGTRLMEWFFPTATFQGMTGDRERVDVDPRTEADDVFARRTHEGIGVEIMGAAKFGPPGWHDDPDWRGWWGEEPPFHSPVVVRTHAERAPLTLGETTFRFMAGTPQEVLEPRSTSRTGSTCASGEARARSATSSPPVSWTTCTSCRCRFCSDGDRASGTGWRGSSAATASRARAPRAA